MNVWLRSPSLRWLLMGVAFYSLFLLASTASAHHRMTPVSAVSKATSPGANPDGSRDVVTLYSEQGSICPPNSKRATYFVGARKETIEGCYVIRDNQVHLGFVDGDSGVLPASAFIPVGGAAPQVAPPSGNNAPGVGPGKDTNGIPKRETPIEAVRGGLKEASIR